MLIKREAITNNGVALFENIEPSEYKILVNYKGIKHEQSLNLDVERSNNVEVEVLVKSKKSPFMIFEAFIKSISKITTQIFKISKVSK